MATSTLFQRKSLSELHAEAEGHALKRELGPMNLIALGIGAIIGAGLFSLTGLAAAQNAGPAVAISMVVAAIGCALAGLCYSEFSCMIPVAGSAYTYAYTTMGEWLAWIIGWDLVLEYAVGAATVSISWSGYVVSLLHDFGIHLPPQLVSSPLEALRLSDGTTVQGIINLPAVFIVLVISALLMVGIKESARTNAVIVVIKVAVVLVFIAIGYFYINRANYEPFIPANQGAFGKFGWSGIMAGAGTIFFAYIGFDAVSTAAQEARNPQRDMPIGIIGSLAICTVLYVLFSIVLTGMVPYQQLNVAAPVAVAIDVTQKPWLMTLIKLGIIAGFTSVILVMLLGQSRVFYSMSRDGLVPKVFSDIHPKFRTPWRSNMLFGLFVAVLAAFLPLQIVGHMTSIGTLFAFVIVCGGVWIMRKTQPHVRRPFRTPLVPLVPILGMGWNLAMMYSLGPDNWTRLILWLVIGQIIFFVYGRRHSTLRHGKTVAYTLLDRVLTFANIGFLVGGTVGYLTRPGNLGFQTVIERGINLQDPALVALAHASFNSMVTGAFVGAAAGALFGYLLHKLQGEKIPVES
ncbi:MAG TPA: amino acid permease [Bryobacteraceae bacterium]|nr:amino acid permease [Bryobacteraceae bacterium]HPQ13971.1 amino acid permease [Bryobacteraceae bacterium]HPU70752.1 amino acid permease [Bryobacteraceae bacterium]